MKKMWVLLRFDPFDDTYVAYVSSNKDLTDQMCDIYNEQHEGEETYAWVEETYLVEDDLEMEDLLL